MPLSSFIDNRSKSKLSQQSKAVPELVGSFPLAIPFIATSRVSDRLVASGRYGIH